MNDRSVGSIPMENVRSQRTDLRLKVAADDIDGFVQILDAGYPVNCFNSLGETFLHYLCIQASVGLDRPFVRMAQELVARGADIEARSSCGETPLQLAAITGTAGLTRFLLDQGALVDAPARKDEPALSHAFSRMSETPGHNIVRILLDAGASTHKLLEMTGELALNSAAQKRNVAAVQELMLHGEDPRIKSPNTGMSALEVAKMFPDVGSVLVHEVMRSMLDARVAGEAIDSVMKKACKP